MSDPFTHQVLDAPCVFCGYGGPYYFEAGTHGKECPWYTIGGNFNRELAVRDVMNHVFNLSIKYKDYIEKTPYDRNVLDEQRTSWIAYLKEEKGLQELLQAHRGMISG